MYPKVLLMLASVSGFLAVALGAFGAHGLRDKLAPQMLSAYETGVFYQFVHTLALLAVALLMQRWGEKLPLLLSGVSFLLGILLFSGSLYVLALGGPRWLGPITPLGGLAFMVGWALLLVAAWRSAG